MMTKTRKRLYGWTLIMIVCLLTSGTAHAYESFTTQVSWYQGIHLTTGMTAFDPTILSLILGQQEIETVSVPPVEPLFEFSSPVDLYFGFSTNAERPFLLMAEQIQAIAVLDNTDFETISLERLADVVLQEHLSVVSMDTDDVMLLLTTDGTYFLLGHIMPLSERAILQFTYKQVESSVFPSPTPGAIPEPSMFWLFGVGMIGVMKLFSHKRRKMISSKKRQKFLAYLIFLVLTMVGFIESVSAAELRIIVKGTGSGVVMGEELNCSGICTKAYAEKTVVHLKAMPFPDSEFHGWEVNGNPNQGAVMIDQDDIVVHAIFDLKAEPTELRVFDYIDGVKRWATMNLDEVVIFLESQDSMGVTTQEEHTQIIEEIVQHFHPQARIEEHYPGFMFLKSPELFSNDLFVEKLDSLTALSSVQKAVPVFDGVRALTGDINVIFPSEYTEEQIQAIENEYGLVRIDRLKGIPCFLYQVENIWQSIEIANRLYESGTVEYANPNWLWKTENDSYIPSQTTNPLFVNQWHLKNTGQNAGTPEGKTGEDIHVTDIWEPGSCDGSGIIIGVIDDGIDLKHEEFKSKIYADWYGFQDDGEYRRMPTHGTLVSGVAAALWNNNAGGVGVAPASLLSNYAIPKNDFDLAKALDMHQSYVHVYNRSWSMPKTYSMYSKLAAYPKTSMEKGIHKGRFGKGNIYVLSAGNEGSGELADRTTYEGDKNSRYTIVVGASNNRGEATEYSEEGANILVNAPSSHKASFSATTRGITTTDVSGLDHGLNSVIRPGEDYENSDYTKFFTGTSAAAPQVTGVIALMLQVKPELKWFDVQQILINTADQNAPSDASWNTQGVYHYSHKFGFGRVNAAKAVETARIWTGVEPAVERGWFYSSPDNPNEVTIHDALRLEYVEVEFTSWHKPWGDLEIVLISPNNTRSILAMPHDSNHDAYNQFVFGSLRHFGEPSQGTWRLEVNHDNEAYRYWKLKLYGTRLSKWFSIPSFSPIKQTQSCEDAYPPAPADKVLGEVHWRIIEAHPGGVCNVTFNKDNLTMTHILPPKYCEAYRYGQLGESGTVRIIAQVHWELADQDEMVSEPGTVKVTKVETTIDPYSSNAQMKYNQWMYWGQYVWLPIEPHRSCSGDSMSWTYSEPEISEGYPPEAPPNFYATEPPGYGTPTYLEQITYKKEIKTSGTYWTETPDGKILKTCTNVRNGNPVYLCENEYIGYRGTRITKYLSWPSPEYECKMTLVTQRDIVYDGDIPEFFKLFFDMPQ